MLDILMPVAVEDLAHALTEIQELNKEGEEVFRCVGAIPQLEEMTDVPFRLVVCVDGGTREDVEPLQRYMPGASFEWALMQNTAVMGFAYTVGELAKTARNDWIAIVPAHIWVDDPKWFGKMQVVFTKDPHCFMCAADVPNTLSATVPPFRLDHKRHSKSDFFLSRRAAMQNVGQFEGSEDFSRQAHQLGGTRWVASGVRFRDAHAHEKDRAKQPAASSDSR